MVERTAVDWTDYVRFQPGVSVPAYKLDRSTAIEEFEGLMAVKGERIQALSDLTKGHDVDLSDLNALGRWFVESVTEDVDKPGQMETNWYSVSTDIGLVLGELVIGESEEQLRWELRTTGRWSVSYQRPVVVGYPGAKRGFHVDFILSVIQMGHKLVQSKSVSDKTHELFQVWVDSSLRRL